jgi:hypothetical protein
MIIGRMRDLSASSMCRLGKSAQGYAPDSNSSDNFLMLLGIPDPAS